MPNGPVHSLTGVITAAAFSAADRDEAASPFVNPVAAGIAGAWLGRLPDMLEPAISPNHRQFFHSWVCLGAAIYGTQKAYDWQPQTEMEKVIRGALIVVGSTYAVHLFLDSLTKRSLPII